MNLEVIPKRPFDDFRALPSHLPSVQERLIAQTILDETLHLISTLESTNASSDRDIKLQTARRKETHIRAFLAPIRLLPDEVLSEIFQAFRTVWGDKSGMYSPWTLASVCRWWRTVAFDTLVLWSSISYGAPLFKSRSRYRQSRYEYQRERCRDTFDLRHALDRSKHAPLDLLLYDDYRHSNYGDDVLPQLLDSVATRIRIMTVTVYRHFRSSEPSKFLNNLITQPLSSLEELKIRHFDDDTPCRRLLQLIDSTSLKLRTINFSGFCPDLFSGFTFWSRITKFTADQSVVLTVLPQCHNLRHLIILETYQSTGDIIGPSPIILNSLESLQISDPHDFFTRFSTPNLRRLNCYGEFVSPAKAAPIHLPSLEELEMFRDITIYADFCIAPNIKVFRIADGPIDILPARNENQTTTLISLEVLELNHVAIEYTALLNLLECNPGIKELCLRERHGSSMPRIIEDLICKARQSPLCPRLEQASIECSPVFGLRESRKALRCLLSSRKEIGHPLSRLNHFALELGPYTVDLVSMENDDDLSKGSGAEEGDAESDE